MKHSEATTRCHLSGGLLALAVFWLAVCAVSAVAEVPRVENSDTPAQGIQKLELEELWTVGGEDDEDNIFGVVLRALVDQDDNIYLLDNQLAQVSVYSPEGELVKTLGQEGDGPGEFRNPTDICLLPDGTLGVGQAFPGKVIKLNMDGTPAGTMDLGDPSSGGFFIMRALKTGGGVIVAGGTKQNFDQSTGEFSQLNFVGALNKEGKLDPTFTQAEHVLNIQNLKLDELEVMESPDRRFDVGPDGRTVIAIPRYGYEISVFAPDGTLERVFTRQYEPWRRNARAQKIMQNIFDTIQRTQAPNADIHIEDFQPDVESLRVARDGSIWVLTSRAMWDSPEGIFTSYDVFSPDGVYQKKLNVICEGDPVQDFLFFAGDDLAFKVTGFWDAVLSRFGGQGETDEGEEPEPMSVVCYRVK